MNIGENIKRIRVAKGLTQKQVVIDAEMDGAQYSRIENGKNDPSVNTLERIAKALGVEVSEIFMEGDSADINSYDKTLMEKIRLMESLEDKDRQVVFGVLDAFVAKKKLKDSLTSVLETVE